MSHVWSISSWFYFHAGYRVTSYIVFPVGVRYGIYERIHPITVD